MLFFPPIYLIIEHFFMNKSYTPRINSAPLWSSTLLKLIEVMEKLQLHYSQKNITISPKRSYELQLIPKIDQVIKQMRWKAFFYMNGSEDTKTLWLENVELSLTNQRNGTA